MKRLLFVLPLLLMFGGSVSAQEKHYVVGFYNVENLFDIYDDPAKNDAEFLPDGKNKWTDVKYGKKIRHIAKVIRAMHDDNHAWHTVLGLSEIEDRYVLEDLVADPQIAQANYQIVHYDGPDRRGVDVAMLYDPAKFTYLDSESIPFDFENSQVQFTLDSAHKAYYRTRDVLMVHGKIDGEDVAVYVCHLCSRIGGRGWDLRARGTEIVYNHSRLMEQKYPGIKIMVMGDMNDNPTDDSQKIWLHSQETIEQTAPGDFYCPFEVMLKDGYGTLAYQNEWSIYDLIHVNYDLAQAPQGGLKIHTAPYCGNKYYGRVFHKPFMTQQKGQYKDQPFRTYSNGSFIGGYSDHYPTYIVISK